MDEVRPGSAERHCGLWRVESRTGTVGELLGLDEPPGGCRVARLHSVVQSALVLGSTQSLEMVDRSRVVAVGVDVVHRRSGGGAVLLVPAAQVWIDFFIPVGDCLWRDDVERAALWVGELWAAVALSFTSTTPVVHRGGLVADRWGHMACFAGVGPGEVLINGRKTVGVSQRRNRHRIHIQTAALVSGAVDRISNTGDGAVVRQGWPHRPERLGEMELLALTAEERAEGRSVMAERCGALVADSDTVVGVLLDTLGSC